LTRLDRAVIACAVVDVRLGVVPDDEIVGEQSRAPEETRGVEHGQGQQ
jgi:hypothetical protein